MHLVVRRGALNLNGDFYWTLLYNVAMHLLRIIKYEGTQNTIDIPPPPCVHTKSIASGTMLVMCIFPFCKVLLIAGRPLSQMISTLKKWGQGSNMFDLAHGRWLTLSDVITLSVKSGITLLVRASYYIIGKIVLHYRLGNCITLSGVLLHYWLSLLS